MLAVATDQSQLDANYAMLVSTLDETTDLLERVGEEFWLSWSRLCMDELQRGDAYGLDRLLGAYGGMGSFNDLVISPLNGHQVNAQELTSVNERLVHLRSRSWELARWIRHSLAQ